MTICERHNARSNKKPSVSKDFRSSADEMCEHRELDGKYVIYLRPHELKLLVNWLTT